MPLKPVTHDFLALVERETGYPVRLIEDPSLETLARVRMARGTVPAHFVNYKPTRDESLDYVICYQCGFILRLFDTPPDQRFDLAGRRERMEEIAATLAGPGGKLESFGLTPAQINQMADTYLSGLMTHLRSIPIGMRVAEWIADNYPELAQSQSAAVVKELAEAQGALLAPIREFTPDVIYKPTVAISAAHAMFWGEYFATPELSAAYRSYGYHTDGRALLKIYRSVPAEPIHDRELVDRWADQLHLTGWYRWVPYAPPQ